MLFIDKHETIVNIKNRNHVGLELGCGNRKRIQDSIGIDILDYECVDIVGDVFDVLAAFPNKSVDSIYAHSFIEHVSNITFIIGEMERVLKMKGVIELVAPHFSNPYYYSDCTHKSFFGLYSFAYFASNQYFKRKVPNYKRNNKLILVGVDLVFKSSPPFYIRYFFKKIIGAIINSCLYAKEFYEENLCYIVPCYEIKYKLIKDDEKEEGKL